jgi:tRNA-uridine 2-sulfurtransferase
MNKDKTKIKVMVAMSGGVDSSVAAFLLQKQGFEVCGVYMEINDDRTSEKAVKKVAKSLGIKLEIVDLRKKFEKEIISYFLNSYKAGLTPNPCVLCNRTIKFGELLKFARKNEADFLATGHYARLRREFPIFPHSGTRNFQFPIKLLKAIDLGKDQSYFLYSLSPGQLKHVLFPLGDLTKDEVRKIADKNSLPYIKKESQDICFLNIRGKKYTTEEYLKKNLTLKSGPIQDSSGKTVGRHQGLPLYTIGQRKGIEIGGTGPYYVTGLNHKKNILFVTNRMDKKEVFTSGFFMEKVNWIGCKVKLPLKCVVAVRYRQQPVDCVVSTKGGFASGGKKLINVKMAESQRAVTPGQSAVFYHGNEVLGGGIILGG